MAESAKEYEQFFKILVEGFFSTSLKQLETSSDVDIINIDYLMRTIDVAFSGHRNMWRIEEEYEKYEVSKYFTISNLSGPRKIALILLPGEIWELFTKEKGFVTLIKDQLLVEIPALEFDEYFTAL